MKKYGLIYRLQVPTFKELVMIHDPQDIEVMFRAEGKYPSRPPLRVLKQARNELKMEMAVLHSWVQDPVSLPRQQLSPEQDSVHKLAATNVHVSFVD